MNPPAALVAVLSALPLLASRCPPPSATSHPPAALAAPSAPPAHATASPPPPDPRVVEVPVPGDLPASVIRGARRHALSIVFLGGMCTHPAGYLAAFPWTAVEHGDVLGLQGDIACSADGTFRRWGGDVTMIDRRIDAAYRAAGLDPPTEVTLIGYSQGAERAERLAARYPARYRNLILLSSPITSSHTRLASARAVLLGVGELEAKQSMLAGAEDLARAGVTTGWLVLPGARHGVLGPVAQDVMGDALAWIEEPGNAFPPSRVHHRSRSAP